MVIGGITLSNSSKPLNLPHHYYHQMKKTNYLKLMLAIIICEVAGAIGGIFTSNSVSNWYPTLIKPWFNPPAWLFGPVWTILYALMGITLYLLWESKKNRMALRFFWIQLILNVLWSILFFGLKKPSLAFIGIVLLWGMILATIIYSKKVNKTASYLLVPYLIWVSFASILNLAIVVLN